MTTLRFVINNPIYGSSNLITTTDSHCTMASKRVKKEIIDDELSLFLNDQSKKKPKTKVEENKTISSKKTNPKVSANVADRITQKRTIYPDCLISQENNLLYHGKPRKFIGATIDFSKKCQYCKQILCEGTTYATFCYERLDVRDEDEEYDVEERFVTVYLLLKDFERFQSTRYTNPDANYRSGLVPQCVLDTFREHFRKGKSKFNEYRVGNRKLKEIE